MKTTTKFLATAAAALAIFFSTNVNAQTTAIPTASGTNQKFGVGVNVGIPTNDGFGLAIGADLRYQIDVAKQLSVPITAGYTRLVAKNDGISFGYIPVKAGLKYFFNDTGAGIYALAEAGAAFAVGSGDYYRDGTSFVYSPAIGYAWSNGLDLGAKYEGFDGGGSYYGLRLAYGFKL